MYMEIIVDPLQCVDLFSEYHHSCLLYLGSVVVDEFGSDPLYQAGLMQFLQAVVEVALPVLAKADGLVENPDTIDDLFRLCARSVL